MSVSSRTKRIVREALADEVAGDEVTTKLIAVKGAALTPIVVTPTTGSLPTASGAITIANTGTPTVVELLAYCTDLKAQVDALALACHNAGVIA